MKRTVLVFAIIIASVLINGCSSLSMIGGPTPTPDKCSPQAVGEYYDAINHVGRRFSDALDLADTTPRMNLPSVISDLQAIRRDAEDLDVPPCAEKAKQALVSFMDKSIDGFLAFLGQKPDAVVNAAFDEASKAMDNYLTELLTLEGMITPTPPAD